MGTFSYIKNFLKDPKVASITPTSRYTINKLCQYIDITTDKRIIEFGPADGVFTKVLLEKLTPGSKIVAIESNEQFANKLRTINDDRLIVKICSAEKVNEIAAELKWNYVDYIISGIPFSFLNDEVKNKILMRSAKLISKEGGFLGYQASSHLEPYLRRHFMSVAMEKELLNIPPMCIYFARK